MTKYSRVRLGIAIIGATIGTIAFLWLISLVGWKIALAIFMLLVANNISLKLDRSKI